MSDPTRSPSELIRQEGQEVEDVSEISSALPTFGFVPNQGDPSTTPGQNNVVEGPFRTEGTEGSVETAVPEGSGPEPSPDQPKPPDTLQIDEVKDKPSASVASLAGSFQGGTVTPSPSVGASAGHGSPVSSTSRTRRGMVVTRQTSGIDKTSSRSSSINLVVQQEHEGSLMDIREESSEDTFFEPIRTVISPMAPMAQSGLGTQPVPMSRSVHRGISRFSVSPAEQIPESRMSRHGIRTRTPTRSESSYAQSQAPTEPDTQFKMSDGSLAKQQSIVEQRPLLSEFVGGSLIEDKKEDEELELEDFLHHVDENQQTIHSHFSINTQDSATFEHAPLQCGNIRFVKDASMLAYEPKKHYLCVGYETQMHQVTEFMARYWGMKNPNIVLSIISSEENYKPWKSQKLKDDFQKGVLKAANTTNMWIVTNGVDVGIPKMIGDAIKEYNIEQQNTRLITNPLLTSAEERKRRLTAIGIVSKDIVPYGTYFDGTDQETTFHPDKAEGVQVTNYGGKPCSDVFELNPEHTHFIMVEEDGRDCTSGNLRCLIEQQFREKLVRRKRPTRLMSIGSDSDHDVPKTGKTGEDLDNFIPVVGLVVQGSPRNIDHILFYLQNKMPVVILKGSGGIADMISFVYEEMQEKADSDPDYEENFLKPELIKMITRVYGSYFEDNEMSKFTLRDKILQCVKAANEGDGDHTFLTIVNMKGWGSNLRDLDKYILRALFKSEKHGAIGIREQLQNDLQLTIDWNRPDLAWEIFQLEFTKVRIDKKMFEKALLQKDREGFIELFLSQGVKVHKFLTHKKLKVLFEKAEDREFFVNVCLEGVLGITQMPDQPLGDDFLRGHLNRLIYKLAWIRNFIQPLELSLNSAGVYSVDASIAERKAMNSLMVWAVLMNRAKLAKTLWNKCDEPIGVALICSRIFKELSKYHMEQYQKTELEENAKEFGKMALGALAICWRDSSIQAYHILGERLPDFNNKSVIEIAHDAGYIHFLAHPCCQKWLTKKFHGHLQIKELDWGVGRLPQWFKILASVFLIFPMYIWISFIPPSKKKTIDAFSRMTQNRFEEDDIGYDPDASSSSDDDDQEHLTKSQMDIINQKKRGGLTGTIKSVLQFGKPKRDIPFHQKIYLLWTAPITKFWTTQVFYFAYLGLFCLATLWPTCGNQILDMILWFWTATIEMELVCRVYRKYHRFKTLSLLGNCIDILLIMAFLVVLLVTRIMQSWFGISNYMQARKFMCYGLIYFFYRLLGVYLPISPTLGPMLLRISRMVKHDFVAWVRMFMIFMIAGGVTIQAVLYPHWPFTMELFKRVITRPIYAMFLTQIQDLDGDLTCSYHYENTTEYCHAPEVYHQSMYAPPEPEIKRLQECPIGSFSGYLITLQYLLICKLVLVTLLFAMFALTIGKIDNLASEIWKFQRYALIADFIERFTLPPPFTILSFLYFFLKFVYKKCRRLRRQIKQCCSKRKASKLKSGRSLQKLANKIDDSMFWKKVAREYTTSEDAKTEKEGMMAKHGDILISLQEDLRTHRKTMKRLNDRVVELERIMQSSRLYLEDIAHKLEKTDVMGITNVKGKFIHIAARQSPYPGTSITRFPVFDKYVPWEHVYDVYDPKMFTLHKMKFPENEIAYVDEDIIEIMRMKEERLAERLAQGIVGSLSAEDDRLSPIPEFMPKWNTVTITREGGEKREIDRRSWINIDDQPLRYAIDSHGIPQNPMGRTGLRGKGNLWRWGPNHVIKAVITRWRRKYGPDMGSASDYLYVEGKRVLEYIAVQKDNFMDSSFSLPGDILHGMNNPYSIMCRCFMSQVFDEGDTGQYVKFDQADMIQFFAQFASIIVSGSMGSFKPSDPATAYSASFKTGPYQLQQYMAETKSNVKTETDQQGFSASLIYKGYVDDPRNTDNAWVEAEVWNFHYDVGDTFDLRIREDSNVKWKEVSPYVKMFANESVIVQEAARIHDAYH